MATSKFLTSLPLSLSRATTIFRNSVISSSLSGGTTIILASLSFKHLSSFVLLRDLALSLLFLYYGLSPTTVRLDERTFIRLWGPTQPRPRSRPSLVLIHGFGGNARWQWQHQIRQLSSVFDLYVPDLIFFGDSFSESDERSVEFQARCIAECLRMVGLERYSVCGISYGGFVAYGMAVHCGAEVIEKVIILTAGICATEESKLEILKSGERDIVEILMPVNGEDLRALMRRSMYKMPWVPSFVLRDFVQVMYMKRRKERMELLQDLLSRKLEGYVIPVLEQETLIIWGDRDEVFPLHMGHQLKRHLGEKSRIEIIKDVGHAAQMESPQVVNNLIQSFVMECKQ